MRLVKNIRQLPHLQRIALLFLALYSCGILLYGVAGALRASGDQRSFHETSRLLLAKIDTSRMTIDFLKNTNKECSLKNIDQHGGRSLYPPSTHVLLVPFYAFLISPELSKYCWLLWNIISLGIIYHVVCARYLSRASFLYKAVLICILVGSASTKTNLSLGQTALFSYAALLLTLSLKKRHPYVSGITFTLAVAKPSLMILFAVYLLLKKEYRTVLTACAMHLILTAGISAWIGTSPLTLMGNYFTKIALVMRQEGALSFYYQTNGIAFKSMLFALDAQQAAITLATIVLYMAALMCMFALRNREEHYSLGVAALLTMLVDYHQHYDFIVLLFMLPVFVNHAQSRGKPTWQLLYFLLLLYMPNLSRINFFGTATAHFFQSHPAYLLIWQAVYTGLYILLLLVYMQTAAQNNLPLTRKAASATHRSQKT